MTNSIVPSFAVVGHPNKGKSSVVSTLARNDQIAISMQSGTTVVSETFDINIGQAHYRLVDTPGFQRPRKVLAWLKAHNPTADKRRECVIAFLNDETCQQQFVDEIELLKPIIDGAAILYVVDGSRPYSPEYEAEMEILRWTGQPTMALINPIQNDDYVANWQAALGQYFSVVRVFDAVKADIEQHIELLQAFAAIHQPWQAQLSAIISAFENETTHQVFQSCFVAAQLLEEMTQYKTRQKALSKAQAQTLKPVLEKQFYDWMRRREKNALDELQLIYRHQRLERSDSELSLPDDLFDTEKWYGWGLSKKQLTSVAAVTGAAAGGALDLAVAGHSFMLGAVGGGVVGSTAAWFGADKLASSKIKGLPMGGYEARLGPVASKNFPYVILARFVFMFSQLKGRNHAQRDGIALDEIGLEPLLDKLNSDDKKKIFVALDRLSRQKSVDDLPDLLAPLFGLVD
ncbi:MAG: GTPase/DUF3482 domain-containing protein [Psychrobium sp.]